MDLAVGKNAVPKTRGRAGEPQIGGWKSRG